MDAKKTFENLLVALMEGEPEGAAAIAADLALWIKKGGAVPQALTDAYVVALPNGKDDNRDERGCAP